MFGQIPRLVAAGPLLESLLEASGFALNTYFGERGARISCTLSHQTPYGRRAVSGRPATPDRTTDAVVVRYSYHYVCGAGSGATSGDLPRSSRAGSVSSPRASATSGTLSA